MKGKRVLCWLIVCCLLLTPFHGVAAEAVPSWVEERNLVRYRGTAITEVERDYYSKVTTCVAKTVNALAKEITAGLTTDLARLQAIYDWVGANITYDKNHVARALCTCMQVDLSEDALRQKKSNAKGLAELTEQLCRAAGIPAQMVGGYRLTPGETWGAKHQNMSTTSGNNHWWNEAYVDGRWRIFDRADGRFDLPFATFTQTYMKVGHISDGTFLYAQEFWNSDGSISLYRSLDKSLTEVDVPAQVLGLTVSGLESHAFTGCHALARITLPATVTSVGGYAFAGTAIEEAPDLSGIKTPTAGLFQNCTNLKHFDFPAYWTTVPADMFQGCTSLEEVDFPANITSVGTCALAGTAIKEAPDLSAVQKAPHGLFQGCTQLKRFDFPEHWTVVAANMFQGCTALEEVTLPAGVQQIQQQAFQDCAALTRLELPADVQIVGPRAFAGSGITEAHLAQVRQFANGVFADCSRLEEVTLPAGLTTIPRSTFQNCVALKTVNTPAGVTAIEREAFEGCASLATLDLPEGLVSLDERALANSGITALAFPSTLTKLEKDALEGLFALEEIHVAEGNPHYLSENGVLFTEGPLKLMLYPAARPDATYTISSRVRRIADRAFAGTSRLETLRINASIPTVGDWGQNTFQGSTSLRRVDVGHGVRHLPHGGFQDCVALTEVNLPETVTSLNLWDFNGCTALEYLNIPASVKEMGVIGAFALPPLKGVYVDSGNIFWKDIDGVLFRKENNQLVWYPAGRTASTYEVPATTASIGGNAFKGAAALTAVILPEGLETVGANAFSGTSLAALDLPDSVTKLSATALVDTPWWEAQPKGPVYCGDAFLGYKGYAREKELVINEGTRLVAYDALEDCDFLKRVTVPASVTRVKDLQSIPASVASIVGKKGGAAETYARQKGILFADVSLLTAGDADGDLAVTTTDARLTLQYAVKKADEYDLFLDMADVDGDGAYTTTDARLMLQYAAGKIKEFPVPKT